jgi:hypothetical protein
MAAFKRLMLAKAQQRFDDLGAEQRAEVMALLGDEQKKSMRRIDRYIRAVRREPEAAVFWLIAPEVETEPNGDWEWSGAEVRHAVGARVHRAEAVHVPALMKQQSQLNKARNIQPFNRCRKKGMLFGAAICKVNFFLSAVEHGLSRHWLTVPDVGLHVDRKKQRAFCSQRAASSSSTPARKRRRTGDGKETAVERLSSAKTQSVLVEQPGGAALSAPAAPRADFVGFALAAPGTRRLLCSDRAHLLRVYTAEVAGLVTKMVARRPAPRSLADFFGDEEGCCATLALPWLRPRA